MPPALILLLSATGPFLRVERIDAVRCGSEGVISVAATELTLEGTLDMNPDRYRVIVDGTRLPTPPVATRTFAETTTPLAIAIVLQANLPYAADMGEITRATRRFVRALPPRGLVSIVTYGDQLHRVATRRTPVDAADALESLHESEAAESHALDALQAALRDLGDDPQSRRVLVTISDGLAESRDRDAFRAFGNLARAERIPIHPVAYSATDDRSPFLNLGEIAKRSRGTFRWARGAADIGPQLENLAAEINRQLILDFAIPDRCQRPHTIELAHGTLRSNARDTPPVDVPLQWWPLVVGASVIALVAGAVLWRRRR